MIIIKCIPLYEINAKSQCEYLGTCEHPDEANIDICFDCDHSMQVCPDCYDNRYDTCPEDPENYRKTTCYGAR